MTTRELKRKICERYSSLKVKQKEITIISSKIVESSNLFDTLRIYFTGSRFCFKGVHFADFDIYKF